MQIDPVPSRTIALKEAGLGRYETAQFPDVAPATTPNQSGKPRATLGGHSPNSALLGRAVRRLLAVGGIQQALAHADILGRDLDEFVVDDVLQGLL